jgi:hypothetical protein
MTPSQNDFIRKLGCLRIELRHLNENLRTSNLGDIENETQAIEELLQSLTASHRKLNRREQLSLRPRYTEVRQEALFCLEVSRRVLDDSLEAMLMLVKTVQDNGNYGPNTGGTFLIDRKA